METLNVNFWGQTRAWWLMLIAGILMICCGMAYWFWPVTGYAVASQLFGWMLIVIGVVRLCLAADNGHNAGRWWFVVGGIIDMLIGFMLVRSVVLSQMVFPYVLAFLFIYWGVSNIVKAVGESRRRYWWIYLVNGLLLMLVGAFFIEAGWIQDMLMTSFLASITFIYWGFSLAVMSFDMKPDRTVRDCARC